MHAPVEDGSSSAHASTAPPAPRMLSRDDPGRYALIVLTVINLLNYIDRYVPSATKQYIQNDLHLSDTETAVPLTCFVFVYMLACPVFSHLADIGYRRSRIIALGVAIWSVATAAGALSINFWTLLISRSLVGVGEAAYATIAPAMLSDFYAPAQRNAVLSLFYLAIPVGAALGYTLGGEVGGYWGWRVAFLVAGIPGLLLAALCLAIKEPEIGALDAALGGAHRATGVRTGAGSGGVARSRSQQDLMFAVDADEEDEDDAEVEILEEETAEIGGGLGGAGAVHPHSQRRASYEPPTPERDAAGRPVSDGQQSRSILVRSLTSSSGDAGAGGGTSDSSPLVSAAYLRNKPPPWGVSVVLLLQNPTYMYCTVGLTLITFASGGLADWIATWMNRVHGVSKESAATLVGALTCVGGIVGTIWGSLIGDYAKGRMKNPYFGVSALNMIVTSVFAWAINIIENIYIIAALVFVAQVCLWAYTGPTSALTVNCVGANMRVRAFAFQILLNHVLGDAISPTIVGAISDATGSIRNAMLIIPAAFTVATLTWLVAWRRLDDEDAVKGVHPGVAAPSASHASDAGDVDAAAATAAAGGVSSDSRSIRDPLLRNDFVDEPSLGSAPGSFQGQNAADVHLKRMAAPDEPQHVL